MIYTVTFNPALDISGIVDELIPDEKSYVDNEVITAGGNGINAAVICKRLGAQVTATGFLGGSNGEEIKKLLKRDNLGQNFVEISGRTRMNLTVSNRKTNRQTRLSFPGPQIRKSEFSELRSLLSKVKSTDLVVFGGSLPPGIVPAQVCQLVSHCRKSGARVMVDIPGKPLQEIIKSDPLFIKPNLVEFQDLTGKKLQTIAEILPAVRKLNLPLVCVSSVEGGAILVSETEARYGRIPKVKVVSSVGAGDSMVGAISYLLHKKADCSVEELLRWGLAAACATLTEKGMTLGSRSSIQGYLQHIYTREIKL